MPLYIVLDLSIAGTDHERGFVKAIQAINVNRRVKKLHLQKHCYTAVHGIFTIPPYRHQHTCSFMCSSNSKRLLESASDFKTLYYIWVKVNPLNYCAELLDRAMKRPTTSLYFICPDGPLSSDMTKLMFQAEGLWRYMMKAQRVVPWTDDMENKKLWIQMIKPPNRRVTWNDYFSSVALLVAQRSNCMKRAVGAVVVKDNRIMSTGYNGTPSHITNCMEGGCSRCNNTKIREGENLDICTCIHAEMNAMIEAGRNICQGCILYVTLKPCLACLKLIVQSGIACILYLQSYKGTTVKAYEDLVEEAGIKMHQLEMPRIGNVL